MKMTNLRHPIWLQYVFLMPLIAVLVLLYCLTPRIAVVDYSLLMRDSVPGSLGKQHLQAVSNVLQSGFESLEVTHASTSTDERETLLAEGTLMLERQFSHEEAAVNHVVGDAIKAGVAQWRKEKRIDIVLAAQHTVDVDSQYDRTEDVMSWVDKQPTTFAPLPVVQVQQPQPPKKTPVTTGPNNASTAAAPASVGRKNRG